MTMRLMATASYPYAGLSLATGDQFEASDKDADLLKLVGRAVDAPALSSRTVETRELVSAEETEADQAPVPRTKRRYQRRDLTAEPT